MIAAAAALCIVVGTTSTALPAERFTLAWLHSVEKTLWEEDYLVAGDWLFATAARIRGSGAGMEPPAGAVLHAGAYRYRPVARWLRTITLANSEFGGTYQLCVDGRCRALSAWVPHTGVTTLRPCRLPPRTVR
jgi:hypothetical protein